MNTVRSQIMNITNKGSNWWLFWWLLLYLMSFDITCKHPGKPGSEHHNPNQSQLKNNNVNQRKKNKIPASDVKRSMADVNSFVKKGSSDDVFE
ncbi:hypothetical protein F2P81_004939 [Scophthalmus maximus]|uniref:Uncharacterized protein n=1 Tax=Scophthalmus maximus TaxID=52904 RepID=A0A6A4TNM7_SCOMX|nr:hypothetical protein F2P81_004939 [Scophthalmus maximus]